MSFILINEHDLEDTIHEALKLFEDSKVNMASEYGREAVMRKIMEAIQENGQDVDDQNYMNSYQN